LESRRLRGDLTALCSLLRRGRGDGGAELCSLVPSARALGNGSTLRPSGEGQTLTLRNISLPRGWPNPGIGFLERCQSVFQRHLDNTLNALP